MRSEKRRGRVLGKFFSPGDRRNVLTSAKMEKGQRTDNPDVATHRKPKKAVIIVELP
jgi:hypothetical protein